MKREFPVLILAVTALVMVAELFTKVAWIKTAASEIKTWGIIIAAFALGLASANLLRFHISRVMKRGREWYSSAGLIASMVAFAAAGVLFGPKQSTYAFYYEYFLAPMTVAMQGLTIFFVGSAAYRAFVVRNTEAALLLGSVVVVILGSIPLGAMIWGGIPAVSKWIMDVPNMAGQRGILITSAIGAIAVGLRVILGLERSHFGIGGE